jgi:ATP phosphoribosyltransferase
LQGSVELAPLVDLADLLVDIVETGHTLRANGLIELEQIVSFEAALIVNRASQWIKADQVGALVQGLKEALANLETEERR